MLVDRGYDWVKTAKMIADVEIDALSLLCPLPVLRARKALAAMAPGAVLRVLADDPMALIDLPHFCAQNGHEILRIAAPEFVIRKG